MRRPSTALGFLLGILLLGFGASVAWADAEQSFKKGLEASDQQDWSEAARHFRQAAAEDGQESQRRVFISGVFSSPYLPHFYLGWALYRWNPQNCSESLQSWEISTRQGVVQTFRRQYQDLQSGQQACLEELLPPTVSGAEAVLRRGRSGLQELVDGGIVSTEDRRSMLQNLEALEGQLAQAKDSKDLESIRQVTRDGEGVVQELEQRRTSASAQSDRRLENAGLDARRALEEAERSERQVLALLADPTYTAARRALPDEGMPAQLEARLDAVRSAASQASRVDEFQAVETEAKAIAEALEASRQRLRGLFDAELRRRAAVPPPPPAPVPARSEPPSDGAGTRSVAESRPPVRSADQAAWDLLRTRTRDLLIWVQGTSPTPLMSLQAQRLEGVLETSTDGTLAGDARQRFDASLEALQVLAAGHAFLVGEPRETLRWVDLKPMTDTNLAAHAHLFAAAARFDLYRRGGEREIDWLDAARADVQQGQRLLPTLEPDSEVFSPAFRSFFERATATP